VQCGHVGTTWRIWLNYASCSRPKSTTQKKQIDRFCHSCTACARVLSGTFTPPGEYDWNCAHWHHLASTIELCFLRPTRVHSLNGKSIGSAISAQLTAENPYTLQWATPLPLSILPLSIWISGPQSSTWFPGPTRVLNPNGISIGSVCFAGLTSVTDRPTDHATWSVTIDRICVRSTGDAV